MKRPITIVGGGLAGLGLANGLRLAGIPVTVLEAGSYPRHRVCGEFMAGLNYGLVTKLGLRSCIEDALLHRSVSWFHRGRLIGNYRLPEPAIGISRYVLDDRMAKLLRERGGEIRQETVPTGQDQRAGTVAAHGRIARRGGYIGMKGHWRELPLEADLELHIGDKAYLGLSRVEDGYVNACGLFRKVAAGDYPSPLKRFHGTLEEHGLGYLVSRLPSRHLRPRSLRSVAGLSYSPMVSPRPGAIGDQGSLIPPFTGNGMTIALESAALVLPTMIDYAYGTVSWPEVRERTAALLRQHLRRRYLAAGLLHPFLLQPPLQHFLSVPCRLGILPFRKLYSLTH